MGEYVPENLKKLWWDDMANDIDVFLKTNNRIKEYTCDHFYNCGKYSDLVYKLEWPDEEDQTALKQAVWGVEKVKPIILCGVVVNNKCDEETGCRYLHLVDINRFFKGNTENTETLHHLRDCGGEEYSLWAWCKFSERAYSIGALEKVKPGTKVVVSLVDLGIASNNSKNLVGFFTDIVAGDDADCMFLDSNYKIHGKREYFEQYKELSERFKNQKQISGQSGGCYIATSVYGSYDCPEVWTLRRYRDGKLASTWIGRASIRIYYAISPTLVKWFGHTTWFKKIWKCKLDHMVANLNAEGVEDTPYEDRNW